MGDFHQSGIVSTLHDLGHRSLEDLESELVKIGENHPMALILPSLFSELEGPALSGILDHIAQVPYLHQVVVGLDRADEAQYRYALDFFGRLPQQPKVLWNDGPRLRKIDEQLQLKGLAPKEPGKGRNVWYMCGYVLASGEAESVALHDCDITTYDRSLLAKLIYPVANPAFSYKFCKGYYARVANGAMNGRVKRLLVTPLLRALKKVCGPNEYLEFLDSFKYALAGEFALNRSVIEDMKIPSDWGLEMGVLSEMHRNYATNQICQVEIADTYDHKHQDLSLEDKDKGLSKMSADIAKSLYRKMATQGEVFSKEKIRTIKATYYRTALDLVEAYSNDATMNGLKYKRHVEGASVEMFAENIMQAGYDFLNPDNSMDTPFMPSWKRVVSAVPDVFHQLVEAVEADHEEFQSAGASVPTINPQVAQFKEKLTQHVTKIYGAKGAEDITEGLIEAAELSHRDLTIKPTADKWDEDDVLMITYGDSIKSEGEAPLSCLRRFLKGPLRETMSGVHILPFNPYSSDDGFSVIDYDEVNPELGEWSDIGKIGSKFDLMADLVINHCSSESAWFQQFLKGEAPGKDYFIDGGRFSQLRDVIRPRSSHLLTKFETKNGEKEIWTTFSADQVDLDFSNPEVLKEMVKVVANFMRKGARIIRLDAIAFLWKEDGTSCVHLPETHEVVKLLRVIVEGINPRGVIITETNVPNEENLSYFGNDNEAHLVYNFSLPPLLLHAMLSGDSKHLNAWNMSMPPARPGRAYFNFIASHDGIGLRPAEGLLSDEELDELKDTLKSFGGEISMRRTPEGKLKAYEANIALYSAMAGKIGGKPDSWQMDRFICAHTVMLALEGLPAFYIHSLLATENDHQGMADTGEARSINRRKWDEKTLQDALNDAGKHHGKVFKELCRRIQIRKKQPAFHPNATQYTLQFGDKVFGVWRESLDRTQSVFAIHNVSDQPVSIPLVELSLAVTDQWCDLLSDSCVTETSQSIDLPPYGAVWISNKA